MRIMICGKNKIAIDVVSYLLTAHHKTEFICVFVEGEDEFAKYLGNFPDYLKKQAIPHASVKTAADFEQLVDAQAPDFIYSIQFSLIIKHHLLKRYYGKILNLHHSLLPYYRGVSPISHAIKNAETIFGVSLHVIDEGVDTGPIIGQKKFSIKNLTNRQVYTKCEEAGLSLIKKYHSAITQSILYKNTTLSLAKVQNNKDATYYARDSFDYLNSQLNFNQTARQVFQQSLAYSSPPIMYPKIIHNKKAFLVSDLTIEYSLPCYHNVLPGIVKWLSKTQCQISTRDCWVTLQVIDNE